MSKISLGQILYSFFEDYLKNQEGLSVASIKSYRDTMRLFLNYVSASYSKKITYLFVTDLYSQHVIDFLKSIEVKRANHIRTRNQRLALLKTFFEYLGSRIPESLVEAERVSAIPTKRVAPSETYFLDRDEIESLFLRLPKKGRFALRDHTLLMFLYNTGARVQEVANLKVSNFELEKHPRVHLHGKGDKWRVSPLWEKTALLLKQLMETQKIKNNHDAAVFQSIHKKPLTRYGIYKLVQRHAKFLCKKKCDGTALSISPHLFRHTTAMHLLESGVEINVIRGWLGHVSLETTNRYAEINLRMKTEAMKLCEPPLNCSKGFRQRPIWRDDSTLLQWLQSL